MLPSVKLWIHNVCLLEEDAMKDAGMRIRVEPELRDDFVRLCREQDLSAAQVLRRFMRNYLEQHAKPASSPKDTLSARSQDVSAAPIRTEN